MGTLRSTDEAGQRLGIPARTLGQWRYLGRGPKYVRVGGHVRYRDEDLESFIESHTVDPANDNSAA